MIDEVFLDRLLELRLEFRNQRHRLGVQIVQIEHQQSRLARFRRVDDACNAILVAALHELHLDAQLARSLLDLGLEKKIIDKADNARRRVFLHRGRSCLMRIGVYGRRGCVRGYGRYSLPTESSTADHLPHCRWRSR